MSRCLKWMIVVAAAVVVAFLLLYRVSHPKARHLADLTSAEVNIGFRPEFHPPYALVMGMPGSVEEAPNFKGAIHVTGPDGMEKRIDISSDASVRCNWLNEHGMAGFILAWGDESKFFGSLRRGNDYRLRIVFTEEPPPGCSLWFTSIRRRSILDG